MKSSDLARISQRAYDESTLTIGNIEVLTVVRDNTFIIAPRGTENDGADILSDLRFVPWRDPDIGYCHKGFLRAAQAVWPFLKSRIRGRAPMPVWFTGHSLGGAIAILLAAKMEATTPRTPAGIVTFGAPRAGFNWVEDFGERVPVVTCYRHGKDKVPSLPHAWWWRGPRHPVKLTRIGDASGDAFEDHRIQGYIDKLKEMGQ